MPHESAHKTFLPCRVHVLDQGYAYSREGGLKTPQAAGGGNDGQDHGTEKHKGRMAGLEYSQNEILGLPQVVVHAEMRDADQVDVDGVGERGRIAQGEECPSTECGSAEQRVTHDECPFPRARIADDRSVRRGRVRRFCGPIWFRGAGVYDPPSATRTGCTATGLSDFSPRKLCRGLKYDVDPVRTDGFVWQQGSRRYKPLVLVWMAARLSPVDSS